MKQLLLLAALACAAIPSLACGGDDDTDSDAAVVFDAADPDALGIDASAAMACEVLCSCMDDFCAQDLTECMTNCIGQSSATVSCRITHCGYAQAPGGGPIHCPHARGDDTPTTPADCLGQ